jgi:hypothetical protein
MANDERGALPASFWGIHSSKHERPVFRGWAKSEQAAAAELERIKASDPEPEDEYWIVRMSAAEVEKHKAMGTMPKDA